MRTNNNTIFCIVVGFLLALSATAQDKMYIMKNGTVSHIITLANVDSVIFYQPEGKIGVGKATLTTDPGVVINGVTWATRNVDEIGTFAATPEDLGKCFQWNRQEAHTPDKDLNGGNWNSSTPSGTTWEAANDPCPEGWRVPSLGEMQTLLDVEQVTSELIIPYSSGIGVKITDITTGNQLILPFVRPLMTNKSNWDYRYGFQYWSRTSSGSYSAYTLALMHSDLSKSIGHF
jgi:hypothetical protein